MDYINYVKNKAHIGSPKTSETPILSKEDEQFLNRIISTEEHPPPIPARPQVQDLPVAGEFQGNDAQIALLDGAQNIELPRTPNENVAEPEAIHNIPAESDKDPEQKQGRDKWSWLRRDSRDPKRRLAGKAGSLKDAAWGIRSPNAKTNDSHVVSDAETKEEEADMAMVLEKLNLAAVNNRAFSVSDETQELLQKFNQVFKDLVNGVPTAYRDLESLLTNGDKQLQKTFDRLPSFLKKLIEQLPSSVKSSIAPEILAAASAKTGKGAETSNTSGKKAGLKIPTLKDLVGKPGAIAAMMRSIFAFMRARFPAFLGLNVLWSMSLFVLLFVLWYCYKRGREVRLEGEAQLVQEEVDPTNANDGAPTQQLNPGAYGTAPKDSAPAEIVPR